MKSEVRFTSNFVAVVVSSTKFWLLAINYTNVHNNTFINFSLKNARSN
jgi:hypothetical protein